MFHVKQVTGCSDQLESTDRPLREEDEMVMQKTPTITFTPKAFERIRENMDEKGRLI